MSILSHSYAKASQLNIDQYNPIFYNRHLTSHKYVQVL